MAQPRPGHGWRGLHTVLFRRDLGRWSAAFYFSGSYLVEMQLARTRVPFFP